MYISIKNESEKKIRQWAQEEFGGKKGAIGEVVDALVESYEKEKQRQVEQEKRIKRFRAMMDKGFKMGLGNKKPYEKREDIYEGARGGRF